VLEYEEEERMKDERMDEGWEDRYTICTSLVAHGTGFICLCSYLRLGAMESAL
jgi:hypothetical protein